MEKVFKLENYKIVAADGRYLGRISTKVRGDSIKNFLGKYGNLRSATSIFNQLGEYGNTLSSKSPFNYYAHTPPKILDPNGNFFAYLTKNEEKQPRVDPDELKILLGRKEIENQNWQ